MKQKIKELDQKIKAIYKEYAEEFDVLADRSEALYDQHEALQKAYEKLEEKAQVNPLTELGGILKEKLKGGEGTYPMHRAKSVLYNWLSNIEKADGNPEHFLQLMANDFKVDFGNGKIITTNEALANWVKTTAASVKWSHHYPNNFDIKEIEKDLYEFKVRFEWQGETLDGQFLKAITLHTWLLEDDKTTSSAKIKQINVAYEQPFTKIWETK